jgi:hypothetical protein
MSNNPFSDEPKANPYASPTQSNDPYFNSATNPLTIPAVFLLVLASIMLLLILLSFPGQFIRLSAIDTSTPRGSGELAGGIVGLIVWPLINVMIIIGAISMLQLKSYRNAQAAAVMALIPICTPCFILGIPFGIWSLILLNREDVKKRFSGK